MNNGKTYCTLCRKRIATHKCRRCGKPICRYCMSYHGLCVECAKILLRNR